MGEVKSHFTHQDQRFFLALTAAAVLIWLRDLTWISSADDTLPILISLPLFWWLACPWKWREKPTDISSAALSFGVIFFLVGIALNLTIVLTVAWSWLLWTWVSARTKSEMHARLKKLMVLPLMAFPWIALDAITISWWFRLSAATTTATLFHIFGGDVAQAGTQLVINGIPVSVEADCSGMNTLQSMLIAGSIIAFLFFEFSSKYWLCLPIIVAVAWLANTVRVLVLTCAALIVSPEFALGTFHTWGGWFVLMVMFLLCYAIFAVMEGSDEAHSSR